MFEWNHCFGLSSLCGVNTHLITSPQDKSHYGWFTSIHDWREILDLVLWADKLKFRGLVSAQNAQYLKGIPLEFSYYIEYLEKPPPCESQVKRMSVFFLHPGVLSPGEFYVALP